VTFFALMGVSFFLSFYFHAVRGYTPLQTGLCLLSMAAGQIIAAPRSTALAQRLGTRVVVGCGLLTVAACFAVYTLVDIHTPLAVLEVLTFFQGFGMGNIMAPAAQTSTCTWWPRL
jgi:Na+/melibiose symporter-like transporter